MAPYADGSPQASQWPIPPGHFFDYELYPLASDAGTSFYHSHVGFQAMTASGPLIVEDSPPAPYEFDGEIILQIGDFYCEDDAKMESLLTSVPGTWPGDPTALMINGYSGQSSFATVNSAGDASCAPWVMNVTTGKQYRVRVIGTTALSLVLFGIDKHDNLTIIETDNSYVYPTETSYMQVDTGQRFSFVLNTMELNQLELLGGQSKFWIQFETREGTGTVSTYAILSYTDLDPNQPQQGDDCPYPPDENGTCPSGLPSSPVLDLPTDVTNWLEYTFQNPPFPGYETPPATWEVTRRIIIRTAEILLPASGNTVMENNNVSWFDSSPLGPTTQTPYLVEILQNGTVDGQALNNSIPASWYLSGVYPAWIGETLEIVWENQASNLGGIFGPHPMHAHGGRYWDMGSGPGSWSADQHAALLESNSINGVPYPGSRRDTTMLFKYVDQGTEGEVNGWRVWRIRVTEQNVGVWMMHCHILQHIIMGQQTVWIFGSPDQIRANILPVEGNLDGYFTYGGDVVGKTGEEDQGIVVAHYFGE